MAGFLLRLAVTFFSLTVAELCSESDPACAAKGQELLQHQKQVSKGDEFPEFPGDEPSSNPNHASPESDATPTPGDLSNLALESIAANKDMVGKTPAEVIDCTFDTDFCDWTNVPNPNMELWKHGSGGGASYAYADENDGQFVLITPHFAATADFDVKIKYRFQGKLLRFTYIDVTQHHLVIEGGGDKGSEWQEKTITVPAAATRLLLWAVTGDNDRSDIEVDEIKVDTTTTTTTPYPHPWELEDGNCVVDSQGCIEPDWDNHDRAVCRFQVLERVQMDVKVFDLGGRNMFSVNDAEYYGTEGPEGIVPEPHGTMRARVSKLKGSNFKICPTDITTTTTTTLTAQEAISCDFDSGFCNWYQPDRSDYGRWSQSSEGGFVRTDKDNVWYDMVTKFGATDDTTVKLRYRVKAGKLDMWAKATGGWYKIGAFGGDSQGNWRSTTKVLPQGTTILGLKAKTGDDDEIAVDIIEVVA